MDEYIEEKHILNETDLNLYFFPFGDTPDTNAYLSLKSRLGHTSRGQGISLLGGIKIGNQYLEKCGPEYIELDNLVAIKSLVPGTNIIQIPNTSETIKISVIPRIESDFQYNETAFSIPDSSFTFINGFCVDLPEIPGEDKKIQQLDGLSNYDFFDHLMSIKYRYLKNRSELYSLRKRSLYGR